MDTKLTVTNNTAAGQFEIPTDVGVARLRYVERGDLLDLVHTEVPRELEGRGYGAALAKSALEWARIEHRKVIPSCPFVRAYVRRHPEYTDILAKS